MEDFLETVDDGYGGKAEVGGADGLAALGGTGGGGNGLHGLLKTLVFSFRTGTHFQSDL